MRSRAIRLAFGQWSRPRPFEAQLAFANGVGLLCGYGPWFESNSWFVPRSNSLPGEEIIHAK
jgi:hypothetical protein